MAIFNATSHVSRSNAFIICWGGLGLSVDPLIDLIGLVLTNMTTIEYDVTIAFCPASSDLVLFITFVLVDTQVGT